MTLANLHRFDEANKAYDQAIRAYNRALDAKVKREMVDAIKAAKGYNTTIENKTGATGEKIMRERYKNPFASADQAQAIVIAPAGTETTRRAATSEASDPQLAEVHRARGWALVQLEQFDEALHVFAKAIDLDPKNAHGHFSQGWLLVSLDRFEEALPAIRRAIDLEPENASNHFVHAMALNRLKRNEEALGAYDRAIDLGLDEAAVHVNRGVTLGWLERYDEALQAYDRASQLNPEGEPFYANARRVTLENKAASERLAEANRCVAELSQSQSVTVSVAPAAAETTRRAEPQLSAAELEKFMAHAKAKPWDSTSGVAPSKHIRTRFAEWLGRGLGRVHIAAAQPNLASAYAAEVSRNPAKRVEGLAIRPHKLPPDAPRPLSMRRAAELTEEELAAKRAHGREQKRRSRQKLNALTHS